MKIKTFTLIVEFNTGEKRIFTGLSRVAVKDFKSWYFSQPNLLAMVTREEN